MRLESWKTAACSFTAAWILILVAGVTDMTHGERLPIKAYTTVDGLAYNNINKIVRDSRGFMWFCTADGLSRFDGYSFTNYGTDQGLPHREVMDLLETREGEYWVATKGGLVRFDPKSPPEQQPVYTDQAGPNSHPMFNTIVPEDGHKYAQLVAVLLQDRSGTIWCGTYQGLYRVEIEAGRLFLRAVDIGIPPEWGEGWFISDLLEGQDGSLWVAAPSGLYRRWPDGSSAHYTKHDGLPDIYLHDLLKDHDGQLWAGMRYGGARGWDLDNKFASNFQSPTSNPNP
jgi:ligand-binding sensor domain-containing protein